MTRGTPRLAAVRAEEARMAGFAEGAAPAVAAALGLDPHAVQHAIERALRDHFAERAAKAGDGAALAGQEAAEGGRAG